MKSTTRYWQGQFDFCGEDPDKFLVLERDGRVTGYIRGNIEKGLLQVLEFGALEDIPATCEALIRSLASRSAGTPVKMMVSDRERESLAPGLTHAIEEDTAMMILVLDDRERARLERTILRPGVLTFWLSDFF
jgi:hypothetical protein